MTIMEKFSEALDSGDPDLREWFLVKSNVAPFVSCLLYVLFVKFIGPAFMKSRKPWSLRNVMLVYNFGVVAVYIVLLSTMLAHGLQPENYAYLCRNMKMYESAVTYRSILVAYVVYLLKYIEFLDTIFFILRKKNHLVTNLHVCHHTTLPFMAWIMLRTELTGFQMFPAMVNTFVHIIMYSYYGLAALGPKFRKYLWWKQYLTILQMTQFVIIFLFVTVVGPVSGCQTSKLGSVMMTLAAVVFLALFFNYYKHAYIKPKLHQETNGDSTHEEEVPHCNGQPDKKTS